MTTAEAHLQYLKNARTHFIAELKNDLRWGRNTAEIVMLCRKVTEVDTDIRKIELGQTA